MKKIILTILLLCGISCAVFAKSENGEVDTSPAEVQSVSVVGTRYPELKSYKTMLAGVEAFEKHRALAPDVNLLKFALLRRDPSTLLDGVTMKIGKNEDAIPVDISNDGTFILPYVKSAEESNAELVLNRNKNLFWAVPIVRSPSVPPLMRRLGDLRLECEVSLAIAKKEMNFAERAGIFLISGGDICKYKKGHFLYDAPDLFDSFTLVFEERRTTFQVGSKQKTFDAPIADQQWPDDTLIEFNFSK